MEGNDKNQPQKKKIAPKGPKKGPPNPNPSPRPPTNFGNGQDLSQYECPICTEVMTASIYICESGHSICETCCKKLIPPKCPLCQAEIKQTRNFTLEAIIEKIRVPCPNKADGCKYTLMQGEIPKHTLECIYRSVDCVFGTVLGKCSWFGPIQAMLAHCKERHEESTNKIAVDTDIVFKNFNMNKDERDVQLLSIGQHLCFYHFKMDTISKNAFWAVQIVGTADYVKKWTYEVHIFNKSEADRKIRFTEVCESDSVLTKAVFESGRCAVVPLLSLKTFIDNRKNLIIKLYIKRTDDQQKKNKPKNQNNNNNN